MPHDVYSNKENPAPPNSLNCRRVEYKEYEFQFTSQVFKKNVASSGQQKKISSSLSSEIWNVFLSFYPSGVVVYLFSPHTQRKPSSWGKKKTIRNFFYPKHFLNMIRQHAALFFFQSKILSDISRFFPASKRFFTFKKKKKKKERDHPVFTASCCQNPIGHGDL